MANKMLIDASHPEETRVVVLRGNRVEEFDFESAHRKQLRGNIYLAKVTRVEPSLQAAFVDYGGNRHGFLAFSEIHPDYYQIPIADRQALIEEEERAQRAADAEAEHRAGRRHGRHRSSRRADQVVQSERLPADDDAREAADMPMGDVASDRAVADDSEVSAPEIVYPHDDAAGPAPTASDPTLAGLTAPVPGAERPAEAEAFPVDPDPEPAVHPDEAAPPSTDQQAGAIQPQDAPGVQAEAGEEQPQFAQADDIAPVSDDIAPVSGESGESDHEPENGNGEDAESEEEVVESVGGGDALEEVQERMARPRRQYKIQEVIKRRQVMLVQVVKEERGSKGAALTTYLSLAGRYSVLMPNTSRGGGISRKITSAEDRRRLKEIAQDLEVPEGMGVILRTAGASRTKTEVKRDFEYLLRLWETVRDLTLKSTAPKLVYEEGSLVKRAIRDLYNKDIDDVIVAGDEAYEEAKDFMRMLMPSHAKNVKLYKDNLPLFTRMGIESQLDAMFTPVVQLRSGGYIVLNQTEALVAIDVNSGRATREHHIEDTALKTNLEAAEEIARQLRLRDLAGLIVIDFIDMDEKRNNRTVERRLKEALKQDRARIQVGRISHFGLLEMSRQRIRSSVLESSTERCPGCGGTGHVRSVSSVALQLLRGVEEALIKSATHNLVVRTRTDVALYVLNHKRAHLRALEERFKLTLSVNADATIGAAQPFVIERGEQVHTPEAARALAVQPDSIAPEVQAEDVELAEDVDTVEDLETAETEREAQQEAQEEGEENGRRRKRRRRRRRSGSEPAEAEHHAAAESEADDADDEDEETAGEMPHTAEAAAANGGAGEGDSRRRRRGRRGRRGRRDRNGESGPERGPQPAEFASDSEALDAGAVQAPPPVEHFDVQPTLADPESTLPREQPSATSAVEPVASPAATEPEPAPPRRRSTVREPAPVFAEEGMTSAATHAAAGPARMPEPPAMAEASAAMAEAPATQEADDNRPRRTGWWARRLVGKG